MADIYIRKDGDPGFNPKKLENEDPVVILLNQIEMLLFTKKGDCLGAESMGVGIENLLWNLNVSAGVIKSAIYNQIQNYCTLFNTFKVEVDVRIFKGTERDIGVIDILVNGARATGYVIS